MASRSLVWMVPAALLAACAEGGAGGVVAQSGPTSTPQARDQAMSAVLDHITSATCDREQSCNTIGPGATFGSRVDCQNAVHAKYAKDLSVGNCPGGIDESAYDECLKSLDAGQCAGPGDTIRREATCSTKSMCLK